MRQQLNRSGARRVALRAQGIRDALRVKGIRDADARADPPSTRQLGSALRRMAVLQIDSVNVFARSHYLPLYSRLGAYDPQSLERMLFGRRSGWVEYWAHMASIIAVDDLPLFGFRMRGLRERYGGPDSWFAQNGDTVDWVRAELAERGPLRPAQIEHDAAQARRGPWWDWNDVKRALELLWLFGEVAIAGRRGFERVYGLAADVLPAEVVGCDVPREDALRTLTARAAQALGVATLADLDDYWRISDQRSLKAVVADLEDAGELVPVQVEGWERGGRPLPAWMHRDAVVPRRVDASALLTPFDPLVWFRDRADRLFDFAYRIEIYTPAPQRRYGYYCLPVLIGDDIVARIDLKADRAASRLLVQAAWWEHGRPADAAPRLAQLVDDAARWQGLETISVSGWGDAVDDLAAALQGISASRVERHENAGAPGGAGATVEA